MLTGRKYPRDLTADQADDAERIGDVCRSVWNTGLDQRRQYRKSGAYMNDGPRCSESAEAEEEHPWLADVPGHCLQTLKDLDRACREHGTFRVRWRSARRWNPSFRFPEGPEIPVERSSKRKARAKLPKLGWVRFRWSRPLAGQVRSATVSRDGDRWFIAFFVEEGESAPERHAAPDSAVGVDRGVVAAAACSDGTLRNREFATPGERLSYRRLQQQSARQQKGSANRRKSLAAMRRLKRRGRDRRADFAAWTANRLAARHSLVAVEDLDIRCMTSSATGTVEQPGSNVSQKTGLNRAILDKGWHKLELALHNTARRTGARIVPVPAPYTSQRCSACRAVAPESREGQARFRCVICGRAEHADVNAGKNVLADGLSVSACGDLGAARSAKQEPVGTREVLPPRRVAAGHLPPSGERGRQTW